MSDLSGYPQPPITKQVDQAQSQDRDALARLIVSRARLHAELIDIYHPPKQEAFFSGSLSSISDKLLRRAVQLPGVGILIEAGRHYWRKSTMRKAAQVVVATATPMAKTWSRRSPRLFLLSSAGAGALLVMVPWKRLVGLVLKPSLLGSLAGEVLGSALSSGIKEDSP